MVDIDEVRWSRHNRDYVRGSDNPVVIGQMVEVVHGEVYACNSGLPQGEKPRQIGENEFETAYKAAIEAKVETFESVIGNMADGLLEADFVRIPGANDERLVLGALGDFGVIVFKSENRPSDRDREAKHVSRKNFHVEVLHRCSQKLRGRVIEIFERSGKLSQSQLMNKDNLHVAFNYFDFEGKKQVTVSVS